MKRWLWWVGVIFSLGALPVQAQGVEITPIAHDLQNPRGVAVLPDGRLLVIEAGYGDDVPGAAVGSGQITLLHDLNGDGDFDDPGERTAILSHFPSYNSLNLIRTGHDEVFGLSGIALLDDGRVFFTKDDPYAFYSRNEEAFDGETGVFEVNADHSGAALLIKRAATLNALVFDPAREVFFVTESGFNRLMSLTLDGEAEVVANFVLLANFQQAVPSGLALDTRTGDVLVALFSGFVHNYNDVSLSFMPGDSKIVRVNPDTGAVTDEITGLTTAIDVATSPEGDIFVAELTTGWPPALMPYDFDLYNPAALPDPGGYDRYTGRITRYPADGSPPVILADRLDTPTNLTYHEGRLYVSTGLGTPGRSVHTMDGIRRINGTLYVISGWAG